MDDVGCMHYYLLHCPAIVEASRLDYFDKWRLKWVLLMEEFKIAEKEVKVLLFSVQLC